MHGFTIIVKLQGTEQMLRQSGSVSKSVLLKAGKWVSDSHWCHSLKKNKNQS